MNVVGPYASIQPVKAVYQVDINDNKLLAPSTPSAEYEKQLTTLEHEAYNTEYKYNDSLIGDPIIGTNPYENILSDREKEQIFFGKDPFSRNDQEISSEINKMFNELKNILENNNPEKKTFNKEDFFQELDKFISNGIKNYEERQSINNSIEKVLNGEEDKETLSLSLNKNSSEVNLTKEYSFNLADLKKEISSFEKIVSNIKNEINENIPQNKEMSSVDQIVENKETNNFISKYQDLTSEVYQSQEIFLSNSMSTHNIIDLMIKNRIIFQ